MIEKQNLDSKKQEIIARNRSKLGNSNSIQSKQTRSKHSNFYGSTSLQTPSNFMLVNKCDNKGNYLSNFEIVSYGPSYIPSFIQALIEIASYVLNKSAFNTSVFILVKHQF